MKRKAQGAADGFANTALRTERGPGTDLSRQGLLCSLFLQILTRQYEASLTICLKAQDDMKVSIWVRENDISLLSLKYSKIPNRQIASAVLSRKRGVGWGEKVRHCKIFLFIWGIKTKILL